MAINLIVILIITTFVYLLAKKIKFIPFPVLLVFVGLIIATLQLDILQGFKLEPGLVLFIFLPLLLFESAFNFDFRIFKRIALPSFLIATFGLLLSSVIIAIPLILIFNINALSAFLFGAIISSTDPVAVLTILKNLGVPIKLNLLIDAESFFNDGTSLVVFKIVSILLFENTISNNPGEILPFAFGNFLYLTIGGILNGFILGFAFSKIIAKINNLPFVEICLTIILALVSFIFGEEVLGVSGVISVLVAGLVMGNYGRSKISPHSYNELVELWEFIIFISTAVIFILIGLEIDLLAIFNNWQIVVITIVTVLIARSISVYSIGSLYNLFSKKQNKVPISWLHIVNWGGLRGALPLVLILSLPNDFVYKDLFIVMAFGVILFTLFFNSLTVKKLVTYLKLDSTGSSDILEVNIVEILISKKILANLKNLLKIKEIDQKVYDKQVKKTQDKLCQLIENFKSNYGMTPTGEYEMQAQKVLLKYCLNIEKNRYKDLYKRTVITEPIYGKITAKVNYQIEMIDADKNQFKEESSVKLEDLLPDKNRPFWYKIRELIIGDTIDTVEEFYMYHKARFLGNEDVIDELDFLINHPLNVIEPKVIEKVKNIYTHLLELNQDTITKIEDKFPEVCLKMNEVACKAESHFVINDMLHKLGEEERFSKKTLDYINKDLI